MSGNSLLKQLLTMGDRELGGFGEDYLHAALVCADDLDIGVTDYMREFRPFDDLQRLELEALDFVDGQMVNGNWSVQHKESDIAVAETFSPPVFRLTGCCSGLREPERFRLLLLQYWNNFMFRVSEVANGMLDNWAKLSCDFVTIVKADITMAWTDPGFDRDPSVIDRRNTLYQISRDVRTLMDNGSPYYFPLWLAGYHQAVSVSSICDALDDPGSFVLVFHPDVPWEYNKADAF